MNRQTVYLVGILFICFAYFLIPIPGNNVISRLALTYSIVDYGTLNIDKFYHLTNDRSFYKGHWYSDKSPGSSFLAVPAYLALKFVFRISGLALTYELSRYFITILTLSSLSAVLCFFIYRFCMSLTSDQRASRLAVFAYALGTPAFVYSIAFFGHQFAAAFLFLSFYCLYSRKNSHGKYPWLAGLLAGLAFFVEYPAAIGTVWLLLYLLSYDRNIKSAAVFTSLAFGFPLLVYFTYNTICFENPISIGYRYHFVYSEQVSRGIMGIGSFKPWSLFLITFSPYRGLFFYSPILLASIAGLWLFIKQKGGVAEALISSLIILSFFTFNASFVTPEGGSGFGPRYIVPMIPFMIPPLALFMARATNALKLILLSLTSISIFITAIAVFTDPLPNYVIVNPFYEEHLPLLFSGYIIPNLILWIGGGLVSSLAVFTLLVILAFRFAMGTGPWFNKLAASQFLRAMTILMVVAFIYGFGFPRAAATPKGLFHQAMGFYFDSRHDFHRALREYKIAESFRQDPYLSFYTGIVYLKLKMWSEALVYFKQVLQQSPEFEKKEKVIEVIQTLESYESKPVYFP